MFRTAAIAVFLAFVFLSGCTDKEERAGAVPAADFSLQDLNGKTVSLSDFQGKVVLLHFWATWCPPCRASVPSMEKLHRQYGDRGLALIGISLDFSGWDYVRTFGRDYGITYPILKGNEDVAEQYMVRTIPYFVLLDREGNVRSRMMGPGGEDAIEKNLRELL